MTDLATTGITNGLVVFISGTGSNLKALLKSPIAGNVQAVLSDNPNADGLKIAKAHNKTTYVFEPQQYTNKHEWERAMSHTLNRYNPKIIALAGFMRVLSEQFIIEQSHKIVNIHPSLLPQFAGLNTHQRAIDGNAKKHGCTIHWLTADVDGGPIIAQSSLDVLADDTADTLKQRVQALEYQLYAKTLQDLLQ